MLSSIRDLEGTVLSGVGPEYPSARAKMVRRCRHVSARHAEGKLGYALPLPFQATSLITISDAINTHMPNVMLAASGFHIYTPSPLSTPLLRRFCRYKAVLTPVEGDRRSVLNVCLLLLGCVSLCHSPPLVVAEPSPLREAIFFAYTSACFVASLPRCRSRTRHRERCYATRAARR